MKNYYLVEKFYGPVSNVPVVIGLSTNKEAAKKWLSGSRGIISKLDLNKVYFHGIGVTKHYHINDRELCIKHIKF